MMDPNWYETIDVVKPYVVKLSTPHVSGTGFLVSLSETTALCAIATAAHVIAHAHFWDEPIRVDHQASGKTLLLKHDHRAIRVYPQEDTAAIVLERGDLVLPRRALELSDKEKHWKPGVEIGWLGYPAMPRASLCFFSGRISAWVEEENAYLVDGVAINGVSGGPAFMSWDGMLAGVVSEYIPNRNTGEALPGLAVIRAVRQFHAIAEQFRTLDEAKAHETPPSASPPPAEPNNQTGTGRAPT